MKVALLICLLFISLLACSQTISENSFIGSYGDTTCFRASECCISQLKIKKDHTYTLEMVGINHGHKHKSFYKGIWKVENELITLVPDKNKKNLKEDLEVQCYQLYQNNLLYENQGKYDPENIAYKKQ